jgi:hypothetical protein
MQVRKLDNGPEIVLVLNGLLDGDVGDGTERVGSSGMKDGTVRKGAQKVRGCYEVTHDGK